MSGSYATFLKMKTIIKEMPTTFFDKLTEDEQEKFNELIQAAETLKPQPSSKTKTQFQKARNSETILFQPRNIIFCLSMKKVFTSKKLKYIRYSFALIRCLLKEAQRNERKLRISKIGSTITPIKLKYSANGYEFSEAVSGIPNERKTESPITPRKLEHNEDKHEISALSSRTVNGNKTKSPIAPIKLEYSENGHEISEDSLKTLTGRKIRNQSKMCELLRKKGDQLMQSKFFLAWLNVFINASKKNINFTSKIQKVMKKHLHHAFQTSFHSCSKRRRPQLSIDHCDFIPLLEAKENTQSNHNTARRELKNEKCTDETENFEVISTGPRKNTKMIKKKKVLLRGSKLDVTKLEVVNKNHAWVQAFAMLKWKKFYFSVGSTVQVKDHIGVLVTQLLSNFADKYQKNIISIFFENLKVRYSVKKQSRNFRISLFTSIIGKMQKSKKRILQFKAFQMIYISAISIEQSIQTVNVDIHQAEEIQNKAFLFYKFFKKIFEHNYLKNKVAGFVAIQNFYYTNPRNNITEGLNNLFTLLQRLIFIKKYLNFYELKDEGCIKHQKAELLYEAIEVAVDHVQSKQKFVSFLRLKAFSKGSIECLVSALERFSEKSEIKYSFLMINAYAIHFSNFKYLRNAFTINLLNKIYFKRLSSCLL